MKLSRKEMNAPWHSDSGADCKVEKRIVYGERIGSWIAETGKEVYELIRKAPEMYECLWELNNDVVVNGGITSLQELLALVERVKPILSEIEYGYEHQRAGECESYKLRKGAEKKPWGWCCSMCEHENWSTCPRVKELGGV